MTYDDGGAFEACRPSAGCGRPCWWRHWRWRHRIATRRTEEERLNSEWRWSYRTTSDECSHGARCCRPCARPFSIVTSPVTMTSLTRWYPVTGSSCSRRIRAAAAPWRLSPPLTCTINKRFLKNDFTAKNSPLYRKLQNLFASNVDCAAWSRNRKLPYATPRELGYLVQWYERIYEL